MRTRRISDSSTLLGLLGASLIVAGVLEAWAQDAHVSPPDRPVLVDVMVVHASPDEGQVDPLCKKLKHQLRMMNFRSLKVMQKERFKLTMGEPGQIDLPAGHRLSILPISVIDQELHMQLQLPGVLNTRVRMTNGRSMVVGGPRYEGGVLVLQLKPEFRQRRPPSEAVEKKRQERHMRPVSDTGR